MGVVLDFSHFEEGRACLNQVLNPTSVYADQNMQRSAQVAYMAYS